MRLVDFLNELTRHKNNKAARLLLAKDLRKLSMYGATLVATTGHISNADTFLSVFLSALVFVLAQLAALYIGSDPKGMRARKRVAKKTKVD